MAIKAACPTCGKTGNVPDVLCGHPVKCPQCGNLFTIRGEKPKIPLNVPPPLPDFPVPETPSLPREQAGGSKHRLNVRQPGGNQNVNYIRLETNASPSEQRKSDPAGTLSLILGIVCLATLFLCPCFL